MGIFLYKENKRGKARTGIEWRYQKKICGGGVVIAVFEYKAGFKWWRGNAWSSPRREKKKRKQGRKEDTYTYQGGQKGGKEMKKKKN